MLLYIFFAIQREESFANTFFKTGFCRALRQTGGLSMAYPAFALQ